MSFISENATARTYAPGYFLANNEDCTRETVQVSASDERAVSQFGGKFVPMGTILPANGATAKGILAYALHVITQLDILEVVVREKIVRNNRERVGEFNRFHGTGKYIITH